MTIEAHKVEARVDDKRCLSLKGLPFRPGEVVEVIVIGHSSGSNGQQQFPLRGKPIRYDDPTLPTSDDDWGALK